MIFISRERFGAIFGLEEGIRCCLREPSKSCRLILNLNSTSSEKSCPLRRYKAPFWGGFGGGFGIKNGSKIDSDIKVECDAITKAAELRFLQDLPCEMLIFESLRSSQDSVSGDHFGEESRLQRLPKIGIEFDCHWQRPFEGWHSNVRRVGGPRGGSKDPPKSKI